MSDNGNGHEPEPAPSAAPIARIVITVKPDGKIGIEGPIHQEAFMLRVLIGAAQGVIEANMQKRGLIAVPSLIT